MSYHQYLISKGYQVPTDDLDLIIRNGMRVMDMEQRGEPLPKFLDWSN